MNIKCNESDLVKTGVYIFKNNVNNKCYIGSTVVSFEKRMMHHLYHLKNGKHKNSHFQSAWNKYGENNFEFDILEICEKSQCLVREQYYLDTILHAKEFINKTSDEFLEKGYNINPLASGTPNLSKETIDKRKTTFKQFIEKASEEYYKFKNFEIDYDDISDRYLPMINCWINHIPWNKGKKYNSTDHLKVKKTITDKLIKSRKKKSELAREKSNSILVFNHNNEFIKEFRSAPDLQEWSLSSENNLDIPFIGKTKNKELLQQNVIRACKTGKLYKNHYFKFKCAV